MKAEIKGKTIPIEQIQAYQVSLEKHDKQISNLITMKNEGVLEIEDLEKRSPQLIFHFYEIITKVVTENGLVKQAEEKSRDKIEFAMKTAVNLQTTLMAQNNQNQWNMKAFLAVLKQDFEASFGSALS